MISDYDLMEFPTIDISDISNPASNARIAGEITRACNEWGFLLVRGHQIPYSDIEEMFTLSKAFFSLPEDVKNCFPINPEHIGYVGSFQDRTKDDKMSMWFSGAPGYLAANKDMVPPFWLPHIQKVEAFKHKCHDLLIKILEAFGLALRLPDITFFAKAHKEHVGDGDRLRFLLYPARGEVQGPEHVAGVTRMIPHTDSNSLTLVFSTGPGLEVMCPDGKSWKMAPHFNDCVLVNVGDTLSYWSGGQLKATLHRLTFDGVPLSRERQSVAYFGSANPETVLRPLVSGGGAIENFRFNGEKIKEGIKVGELQTIIMRNIYGGYQDRAQALAK